MESFGFNKIFYIRIEYVYGTILLKQALYYRSFQILSLLILVATLIFIFKYKKDEVSRRKLKYLMITMAIYSGGYCLFYVESRYLLIISVLILLMGVYIIEKFYKNGVFKPNIRILLFLT